MGRQRSHPFDGWRFLGRPGLARIEQDLTLAIATYEIACASYIDDAGPAMCVHGNKVPRADDHFEVAHKIVLKQIPVEGGSGNHGVKFIRPRPGLVYTGFYPHTRAPFRRSNGDRILRHSTRIREEGKKRLSAWPDRYFLS